jgi:hypothetical protein
MIRAYRPELFPSPPMQVAPFLRNGGTTERWGVLFRNLEEMGE